MSISMRKVAVTFAMMTFMAMMAVGCMIGQPPLTCCIRAVCGAVAAYIIAGVALRLIVDVMIRVVADSAYVEGDEGGITSVDEHDANE